LGEYRSLVTSGEVQGAVLVAFFSFLISFVAHVESVFVLVVFDRRPAVRRSAIGSTSSSVTIAT
jgi:hypothetical protein